MQILSSAPVRLLIRRHLIWTLTLLPISLLLQSPANAAPTAPKTHTVTLGPIRRVSYTPTSAGPAPPPPVAPEKPTDAPTLKVRALFIDGRQREWTTGDAHDVTDRSFTIRRAMRLNDQLPAESAPRWSWQPGPWLLIDRTTGRVTALHLPDFDVDVSDAIWFRDYAAYCGTASTVKGGLFAVVAQLGARRAVVSKQIGKWPQPSPPSPVCKPAVWQREPLRVTLQLTGGAPTTYAIEGSSSLIEESDDTSSEDN